MRLAALESIDRRLQPVAAISKDKQYLPKPIQRSKHKIVSVLTKDRPMGKFSDYLSILGFFGGLIALGNWAAEWVVR